jgi:hypothetical protein
MPRLFIIGLAALALAAKAHPMGLLRGRQLAGRVGHGVMCVIERSEVTGIQASGPTSRLDSKPLYAR